MQLITKGDYYPRSIFGRGLNLFISLFGISIMSMLVSIITVIKYNKSKGCYYYG